MSLMSPTPTRFLVTTPGLSATRWLCFALASHPEVFVAHGKHALDSIMRGQFHRERGSVDRELMAHGTPLAAFYETTPLEAVFAKFLEVMPQAKAVGNVHAYTIEALMKKVGEPSALADINVLNLLRHPVRFIASHTALVRQAEGFPIYRHYAEVMFSEALRRYPELLEWECPDYRLFVAFCVSCLSVTHLAADFRYPQFESVRMEVMTSDLATLKSICQRLTGLDYPAARLEAFIRQGPINLHRQTGAPTDPHEIFRAWSPWQKTLVLHMLPAGVIETLAGFGYDVSMLQRPPPGTRRAGPSRTSAPTLAEQLRRQNPHHPWLNSPGQSDGPASDAPPELLETSHHGFNIVGHRGRYYVLAQALGAVDLATVRPEWLQQHQAQGRCFVADSLPAARAWVYHRRLPDFEALDQKLGQAVAGSRQR